MTPEKIATTLQAFLSGKVTSSEATDAIMTLRAKSEHTNSFHRYGSDDPTPDNARLADSVSVARCSCGRVCLRFHHPATTTHPGRVFAAAYLKPSDCANIGEDVLKALDSCRHNIPCDGQHHS